MLSNNKKTNEIINIATPSSDKITFKTSIVTLSEVDREALVNVPPPIKVIAIIEGSDAPNNPEQEW